MLETWGGGFSMELSGHQAGREVDAVLRPRNAITVVLQAGCISLWCNHGREGVAFV